LARKDKTTPDVPTETHSDDSDVLEPLAESDVELEIVRDEPSDGEPEEDAAPAKSARKKISRSEVLDMMASKNEINARLVKENREKEAKLKELNDKWLRSAAEFENYRKRTRKEWELLKQQSRAEVILEILAIVDDFERAFSAAEEAQSGSFIEGFRLIYNNLTQALERMGVRALDALHRPFDPNFHMAVGQIDRDDLDGGVVAEVVQKGYLLDDVVIRPASVLVAK